MRADFSKPVPETTIGDVARIVAWGPVVARAGPASAATATSAAIDFTSNEIPAPCRSCTPGTRGGGFPRPPPVVHCPRSELAVAAVPARDARGSGLAHRDVQLRRPLRVDALPRDDH